MFKETMKAIEQLEDKLIDGERLTHEQCMLLLRTFKREFKAAIDELQMLKVVGAKTEFEEGDTVRLKSGGPIMTVMELGDDILCLWFEGYTLKERLFRADALEPVDVDAEFGEPIAKPVL